MSPVALVLLLLAAILHAWWNVLTKSASDRQSTLWCALLFASMLLSPGLVLAWPPPLEAVQLSLASSLFETLYFVCLVAAYEFGDLSLVYPVARGSAPLLIAAWAVLLLGERPSLAGWGGIGLLVAGLVLASSGPPSTTRIAGQRPGLALVLALVTGVCTSGYTTINKVGLSYLSPIAYTCLFHLGTSLLLLPYQIRVRGTKLLDPWRCEARQTALIGVMLAGASALVAAALAIERVGYVGAVREISVILGALAGWLKLREPLGRQRTLAATIMFAGLALIATLG